MEPKFKIGQAVYGIEYLAKEDRWGYSTFIIEKIEKFGEEKFMYGFARAGWMSWLIEGNVFATEEEMAKAIVVNEKTAIGDTDRIVIGETTK